MTLHPGDHLGPYEVVAALGAGGMGEVYRGRDPRLGRDVAIKVLPATPLRRSVVPRALRSRGAGHRGSHPSEHRHHPLHRGSRRHALSDDGARRGSAAARVDPAGRTAADGLLEVAIPLTDAVAAAHQRGITHRDLKPANVMVSSDGRLKVLDFGLAKLTEARPPRAGHVGADRTAHRRGSHLGTAAYMSPEQAEGKSVDARTDIFSLGIILFEL